MALVCIDTQILIWAIKEESEPDQKDMIRRAKELIDRLDKSNRKMLVPSVVVGEFLIKIPTETHQTIINLLQRQFMIAQYDVPAASHYAKIWRAKAACDAVEELKRSGMTRQELKADRMIVATALANGAECIYSHDKGVKTFGEGFVEVRCVPETALQSTLF